MRAGVPMPVRARRRPPGRLTTAAATWVSPPRRPRTSVGYVFSDSAMKNPLGSVWCIRQDCGVGHGQVQLPDGCGPVARDSCTEPRSVTLVMRLLARIPVTVTLIRRLLTRSSVPGGHDRGSAVAGQPTSGRQSDPPAGTGGEGTLHRLVPSRWFRGTRRQAAASIKHITGPRRLLARIGRHVRAAPNAPGTARGRPYRSNDRAITRRCTWLVPS